MYITCTQNNVRSIFLRSRPSSRITRFDDAILFFTVGPVLWASRSVRAVKEPFETSPPSPRGQKLEPVGFSEKTKIFLFRECPRIATYDKVFSDNRFTDGTWRRPRSRNNRTDENSAVERREIRIVSVFRVVVPVLASRSNERMKTVFLFISKTRKTVETKTEYSVSLAIPSKSTKTSLDRDKSPWYFARNRGLEIKFFIDFDKSIKR